jgi:hypothetical protein
MDIRPDTEREWNMHRLILIACLTVVFGSVSQSAQAGWYEFWHRVHLDWKRNNAWPEPFVRADRRAYFEPFELMNAKGWLRQNTIGNHHFNPDTNQLTEAGQLKVRWILSTAPPEHRIIVLVRGHSQEVTATRMDSVQQTATNFVPEGPLPEVRVTGIEARGWPARDIDAIGRKAQASMPAPILPAADGSGS